MTQTIYTNVTNGRVVDRSTAPAYTSPRVVLFKDNFLSEYKTKLEIAKVKKNLGIIDSDTIEWKDIKGTVTDNSILATYMNNVLFDITRLGETIELSAITTLQDAIVYVYGQNQQVLQYNTRINTAETNASNAVSAVDTIKTLLYTDGILPSETNVLGQLRIDVTSLQSSIGDSGSTGNTILSRIGALETAIGTNSGTSTDSLTARISTIETTIGASTDETTAASLFGKLNKLDSETKTLREKSSDILALSGYVSTNTSDIITIKAKFDDYYTKTEVDTDFAKKSDYFNKTDINTKLEAIDTKFSSYATTESLDDYLLSATADTTYAKISTLSDYVSNTNLTTALSNYLLKNSEISITGITSTEDSISLKKPLDIDSAVGALDPDLVVTLKSDLLTLTRYWAGMTVVVLETTTDSTTNVTTTTATQYILLDESKIAETDYSGWRPESSMRFQSITLDAYDEAVEDGTLDANIYYCIEETTELTADSAVTYPVLGDEESDTDYAARVATWQNNIRVLHNYYMSAAWGNELTATISTKASSSALSGALTRISTLETFVGSDSTQTTSVAARLTALETSNTSILERLTTLETNASTYALESEITTLTERIASLETNTTSTTNTSSLLSQLTALAARVSALETPASSGTSTESSSGESESTNESGTE